MANTGTVAVIVILICNIISKSSGAVPQSICKGCNVSKGCFGGPTANCVQSCSCTYLVTYKPVINSKGSCNAAKLQLYVNLTGSSFQYIAMGFSKNQAMGNTSVTQCTLSTSGNLQSGQSYNPPNQHYNILNKQPLNGVLSASLVALPGSYLTCNVKRARTVTIDGNKFDVCANNLYLLVAAGPLANQTTGQVAAHTMMPLISATTFNISSTAPVQLLHPQ